MRTSMFDRLLNATIDTTSKHLASSLRKGGVLHHPFYQPVMKFGQRYFPTPVNEEKAMQAGAEVLVCYTLAGLSFGVMVYSVKKYFDLEKYNRSELEHLRQSSRQQVEEAMAQLRQQYQIYRHSTGDKANGAQAKTMDGEKP